VAKSNSNNALIAASILVLVLAAVLVYQWLIADSFNWQERYKPDENQPYDTDIVYNLLRHSGAFKEWITLEDSLHSTLPQDPSPLVDNYLFIGNSLYIDSSDTEQLISFAEEGNTVFLSLDDVHNFFLDSLFKSLTNANSTGSIFYEEPFEMDEEIVFEETQEATLDSAYSVQPASDTLITEMGDTIIFTNDSLNAEENYFEEDEEYIVEDDSEEFLFDPETTNPSNFHFVERLSLTLEKPFETSGEVELKKQFKQEIIQHSWAYFTKEWLAIAPEVEVLGYANEEANFISWQQGKGTIYIHTTPLAFSNYPLLSNAVMNYSREVLSVLGNGKTYWDEENRAFHKEAFKKNAPQGAALPQKGPLEFILSEPSLRTAWYILLLGLVLYALFGAKRTQRIIPVKKQLENSSIEYTEVISHLFMNQKDHYSLIKLKSELFKTTLRERYGIRLASKEEQRDTHFHLLLQQKTGVDKDIIKKIIERMQYFQSVQEADTEQMLEMHNLFEAFYEKAR
jgi:hypothetical protein